jgi:hypothetical protein
LFLFVFVLAFLPRLTFGLLYYNGLDNLEINCIVKSLVGGHGFANPFSEKVLTGPTAINPPLYVCLKAGVCALWRDAIRCDHAMVFLSSLFTGLLCALWTLSEHAGVPKSVGLLAGILAALLPIYGWLEIHGPYEQVLMTLCAALLAAVMLGHLRDKALRLRSALSTGCFAGLALLLSSSIIVIVGGLIVAGAFLSMRSGQWRAYARYAVVLVASMLVVQAPWVLRNWAVLGRPVLARDGLGLELWVSNNPVSVPRLDANLRIGYQYANHPFHSEAGLAEMQRLGELRFFDECGRKAVLWIKSNPRRFLKLTAVRILLFWFPVHNRPWQTAARWLVTLGGFLGLAVLARKNGPVALAIGCVWLFYPLVYYLVNASSRYTYPVYQSQLLLCACALAHVAGARLCVTAGKP